MEGKTCSKCGEYKAFEEFSKRSNRKSGYRSCCKECDKKHRQENAERIKRMNKQYRLENNEKISDWHKAYYKENKDKLSNQQKEYYYENKELIAEKSKKYRHENKDKEIERHKKYYHENKEKCRISTKNWERKNKERYALWLKRYYQSEPGKEKTYRSRLKRRSYKHKVSFTPHQRKEIIERDKWTCSTCGIKVHDNRDGDWNTPDKAHIDHIIPISKGGNSDPRNLRVLCRTCNLSKNNKQDEQLKLSI